MKYILRMILPLLLLAALPVAAQDAEMADGMRSSGKIYVLLTIIMIVLFGLIAYLISLDRKVGRIERKLPGNKP